MSRKGALAVIAMTGATLVGCSGHKVSVPAVSALPQQDRQAVGSAHYDLEPGGGVEIYHQGYGVRNVQGVPIPTLRIQVSVENDGSTPMVVKAGDTKLIDSLGDTLSFSAALRDGQPTNSLPEVAPGEHAQFDLFYDLPAGYDMARVESFRCYWGWQRGAEATNEETLFVRKDPENMFWRDERGRRQPYRYFMAVKA